MKSMRSLSRREYMSNCRSPRGVCSTTIGTSCCLISSIVTQAPPRCLPHQYPLPPRALLRLLSLPQRSPLRSLRARRPSRAQPLRAPPVSYTHLRAHETGRNLVCRLLLEKKKTLPEGQSINNNHKFQGLFIRIS